MLEKDTTFKDEFDLLRQRKKILWEKILKSKNRESDDLTEVERFFFQLSDNYTEVIKATTKEIFYLSYEDAKTLVRNIPNNFGDKSHFEIIKGYEEFLTRDKESNSNRSGIALNESIIIELRVARNLILTRIYLTAQEINTLVKKYYESIISAAKNKDEINKRFPNFEYQDIVQKTILNYASQFDLTRESEFNSFFWEKINQLKRNLERRINLKPIHLSLNDKINSSQDSQTYEEILPAGNMSREQRLILEQAILKVKNVNYRNAVIAADIYGLSYEEAAIKLDRPLGTFKNDLARGRAEVRQNLGNRLI